MSMQKMSKVKWSAMNHKERLIHLRKNEIVLDSMHFPDGNERHVAYCGGVLLSHWHQTKQEALEVAVQCLSNTIQNLQMKINE